MLKGFCYLLATIIVLIIITILIIIEELPVDYYLIPLSACGSVALGSIIYYFKQPNPISNTYFMVWIVLFINSFIAPIIHFRNNYWVIHMLDYPSDWKLYAFYISCIYLTGIVIFNFILRDEFIKKIEFRTEWTFKATAPYILLFFMFCVFLLQCFVYAKFGGIMGYINAYKEGTNENSSLSGMGIIFIFSELFPYLFTIYFIVANKDKEIKGAKVSVFLVLLFISALFFGGIRGSRSNTLFVIIQAIIAIHFILYKFKKNHVIYFISFFFLFMFIGRLYKDKGNNILDFKEKIENRLEEKENISELEKIIIGDLSRYAINSYQLYKLDEFDNYKYKYGQTYLTGILTFIPFGGFVRDEIGLKSRTDAGTELLYTKYSGKSQYRNTRIFGLVGEWFLNFGFSSFIIPYILLAIILRYIRRWTMSVSLMDARILLIPIIIVLIPNLLLADLSNIFFFIVKRLLLIVVILYFITNQKVLYKNP